MAAGDELKMGKIAANTDSYGMGMDGSGIGSSPITMPNTDYNSFRTNKTNNNIGFLGLTAQRTTVPISSQLDAQFGNMVGLGQNIFSPEVGNKLHLIS